MWFRILNFVLPVFVAVFLILLRLFLFFLTLALTKMGQQEVKHTGRDQDEQDDLHLRHPVGAWRQVPSPVNSRVARDSLTENGGRDRDRTCDPYHVNEPKAEALEPIMGQSET
jgi:hypothetical protein